MKKANTSQLTRILTVLAVARKPMIRKELESRTGLRYAYLNDGLFWLVNRGLVIELKNEVATKRYLIARKGR